MGNSQLFEDVRRQCPATDETAEHAQVVNVVVRMLKAQKVHQWRNQTRPVRNGGSNAITLCHSHTYSIARLHFGFAAFSSSHAIMRTRLDSNRLCLEASTQREAAVTAIREGFR